MGVGCGSAWGVGCSCFGVWGVGCGVWWLCLPVCPGGDDEGLPGLSDCFLALPALLWGGVFLPFWGVCFGLCGAFGVSGGALPACPALIPHSGFRCALFYFGMGDLRFFGFPAWGGVWLCLLCLPALGGVWGVPACFACLPWVGCWVFLLGVGCGSACLACLPSVGCWVFWLGQGGAVCEGLRGCRLLQP